MVCFLCDARTNLYERRLTMETTTTQDDVIELMAVATACDADCCPECGPDCDPDCC